MPRPFPQTPDRDELERRYRLEKRLAERLRRAPAEQRGPLYGEVYAEYGRQMAAVGAVLADDPGSLVLQRRLLQPWRRRGLRMLEIGAGSGAVARSMLGDGRQVVAVEASIPASAGEDAAKGLTWLPHGELSNLSPKSFDLAYSCHVVEHLHPGDLPSHLLEIERLLRPGGAYLFVTPNRLHGPHDISAYFADRPQGLHLREYSHGDLVRAARRAGFARVKAVSPEGRTAALWPRLLAETALELAGQALRRRLFDGVEAMHRRMPLRPLEQVTLAAFTAH